MCSNLLVMDLGIISIQDAKSTVVFSVFWRREDVNQKLIMMGLLTPSSTSSGYQRSKNWPQVIIQDLGSNL